MYPFMGYIIAICDSFLSVHLENSPTKLLKKSCCGDLPFHMGQESASCLWQQWKRCR